jgi:hydroxyacyl-ACP dehydratase HTD2-like protein with hotdog domain
MHHCGIEERIVSAPLEVQRVRVCPLSALTLRNESQVGQERKPHPFTKSVHTGPISCGDLSVSTNRHTFSRSAQHALKLNRSAATAAFHRAEKQA